MDIRQDEIIESPISPKGDGIDLSDGQEHTLKYCKVDFAAQPLDNIDEALGVTWGSSGKALCCTFTGAGKLVLCGSGDADKRAVEEGKHFELVNCDLHDFGRRAPEVQAGMRVTLRNCTIYNWGIKHRFDTRAFGARAHHGGHITCINCRFIQSSFWQTGFFNFWRDLFAHVSQAVKDRGLRGLRWADFVPGVCRGLTADTGGTVEAIGCGKNKWWIRIEGQK